MQRAVLNPDNGYITYKCPSCGWHSVPAEQWNFNGDLEKPTLSPSVRHFIPANPKQGRPTDHTTCHYFIKNGFIEFCSDCPHQYAGQRIELKPITQAEAL